MQQRQREFLFGEDARRFVKLEEPMELLIKSEGWQELKKIAEGQRRTQMEKLVRSPSNRPDGTSDDFIRGAIFGLDLLIRTPEQIIEQAKAIRTDRLAYHGEVTADA